MEFVYVVPREALFPDCYPQGLVPFGGGDGETDRAAFLERIEANGFFVERAYAERTPTLKQVIPYTVVVSGDGGVFLTKRLPQGGESRLVGKLSIGIGGHINPVDHGDIIAEGTARELEEELESSHDINFGVALDLTVEPKDGEYEIAIGDQRQTMAVGEWSDFYELTFDLNPMLKIHGVTRLKLVSMEPEFRLFINTLDIAPEAPPFWQEITAPADYASELASSGTFETYGWACMTMPFKDGEIEPELLLEDIEFTLKWRERVTFDQLARNDWQLFMSVFSTPDRVQHMFYQYYDEGHPQYDEAVANRTTTFFGEEIRLKDAIPKIFEQVDRVVGRVLDEVLQEGDVLLMCADHGLQSFRYQVHINNMLHQLGFLSLKEGATVADAGSLTSFIDWKNTRAYAMGLGYIYLNLQGREKHGIVRPDEVEATVAELKQALLDWRDPVSGETVVESVYVLSEEHTGEYIDIESDLVTGFKPFYRVSWKTNGGKYNMDEVDGAAVPGPVITDNTSPWSGGHPSMAEHQVRGLFFSSVPMDLPADGPNLLHIAPTVLDLLGVPVPEEMDKAPLKPAG